MKTDKSQIIKEQLNQLIKETLSLPKEPVGEHLPDERFVEYSMGLLTEEEVQQVDAHLESCPDCAEQMEALLEASEAWRGETGKKHLTALRDRRLGEMASQEPLTESIMQPVQEKVRTLVKRLNKRLKESSFPPIDLRESQLAFTTPNEPKDFDLENGYLFMEEDADGNVIVRFDSEDMDLEGTIFRCYVGDEWEQDRIKKVEEDLVGAEIVFKRNKRRTLPPGTVPRFELVDDKEEDRSHEA